MNHLSRSCIEDVRLFKLGSNILGKPNVYVYSFLVDGLLIDTGQPLVGREFVEILQEEDIDKIILTHHHEDHSGNVELIKKSKGINAYGSSLCCEIMLSPPRIEPARLVSWGQNKAARILPIDMSVPIKTDSYSFQVFHTPGHAADQISLYEANRGWLFPGDLFVHDYIRAFMRTENMGEQIQSIDMLLTLDFTVLFCHHQPVSKNAKQRLANKLNFLEDFYGKVKEAYLEGMNPKQIMKFLGLKEQRLIKFISLGQLSTMNMIHSVIRDLK